MRPRWPSTGRGRAPTHLQGRSAAEDGRRRLSCLARNAGGEAVPGRGRKPATAVAVQAPEAGARGASRSRPPSRLAHQEDETGNGRPEPAQDGDAASALMAPHPATRTAAPGTSSAASPPRSATTGAGRTTTGPLDPARLRANGPIEASGLDRPTRQGRHARACPLGQAPHRIIRRICDSRVEAACIGRTDMMAPTDTEAPRREAGRLTRARCRRRERSEAAEQTRGPAGCLHPAGLVTLSRPALPVGDQRLGTCPRAVGERGLTTGGGPLYGA